MTRSLRLALMIAAAAALSGCSLLGALDRATTQLDAYQLRATDAPVREARRTRLHLIVEPPIADAALDSDRILIRPNRLQAQYLPDGRWADSPAKMVQSALVRELDRSRAFSYVGREPLGIGGDYALLTEITDFQPELDAEGGVRNHIRISARLVRERDVSVVAQRVFEIIVPGDSTATPQLVAALDAAMTRIVGDMVSWVVGTLA